MVVTEVHTPNKHCHNCRRQRLRCDRSYPHCNKCVLAGKECLGYGQLFRWTGAIASRGKLAGRTSNADISVEPYHGKRNSSSSRSRSSTPPTPVSVKDSKAGDMKEYQIVPRSRSQSSDSEISSPWVLTDPVMQDLSYSYRHYLSYFTDRVCKDLVSCDVPEQNPFRGLIPLTADNPLLQHIIVAASAAHMANVTRPSLPSILDPDMEIVFPVGGAESRQALQDSLVAKHKALQLMHSAVRNIDAVRVDVVLAASLFFINIELIESGKHGWQAHLEGAGRLMSLMDPSDQGTASTLRDYLLSDCFIYFVLASAFTHSGSRVHSYFESSQIPKIIGRATANSYLCCPPEILQIIYDAAMLSNIDFQDDEVAAAEIAKSGLDLLKRAENFDIRSWAVGELAASRFDEKSLASRMNAASAHRLAACLYIIQAIDPVWSIVGQAGADTLDQALVDQLTKIPPEDTNFKATTWPTFILGAGASETERRAWVMQRLQRLVITCPWGFLYTAMEALQTIWRLQTPGKCDKTWIQTLKDPSLNFLMV